MFRTIVVRGHRGAIVWGAGEAAALSSWAVARDADARWTLSARVARSDGYRLRQVPLLFQAPRVMKPAGLWCFPVLPNTVAVNGQSLTAQTVVVNGDALTASLGPPEGR